MEDIRDPLADPPPSEVPLRDAPLVRVIAQVRFPLIAAEDQDSIAPFQAAIRSDYPVLRKEQTQRVMFGPAGLGSTDSQTTWRFSDVDSRWRVSLASNFLALETTKYSSRSDLLDRFRKLLVALEEHFDPKLIDRLGLRYIDRVRGQEFTDIERLVRPELRGITGTPAAAHAQHALTESLFSTNGAQLLARWGHLPAHGTMDAAAIEPDAMETWILDLDMFRATSSPFRVEDIVAETRTFAERIYTFFRWAVSDEFLRRYGGEL
jgi:uncharacterized protein (TIGR04255 family)